MALFTLVLSLATLAVSLLHAEDLPPRVIEWGKPSQESVPAIGERIITVAAGGRQSLAVTASGSVIAWGTYHDFEAGIEKPSFVPSNLDPVGDISVSASHCLALTRAGRVVAWGDNYFGEVDVPENLGQVNAIAAGTGYSLAVTQIGKVVAWGGQECLTARMPPDLPGVTRVAAGLEHVLALTGETLVGWGYLSSTLDDVPDDLPPLAAIAAGDTHNLAVTTSGTVVAWGSNAYGQCDVPAGLADVVQIAAGGAHSLALTVYGKVFAWGANEDPAMGDFDPENQSIVPSGLDSAASIAAGWAHSIAARGEREPNLNRRSNLPLVGRWSWHPHVGGAMDVAITGNLALLAAGDAGLQIIDIGAPHEPQLVGSLDVGDSLNSVVARLEVAFLAGDAGLHVIDVTDAEHPHAMSLFETQAPVRGVALSGDYAYLATSSAGLRIADVSDPSDPRALGSLEARGRTVAVAVSGNHAYIIETITEEYYRGTVLTAIDVSDPLSPRRVGSYEGFYDAESGGYDRAVSDVVVDDNYAYLTVEDALMNSYAYSGSFAVVDIRQPDRLELLGQVPTLTGGFGGDAYGVTVDGRHACVSFATDSSVGIRVFDITDPAHPSQEGYFERGPLPLALRLPSVAVVNDVAYLVSAHMGLAAIDLVPALANPHVYSRGLGPEISWDFGALQFAPDVNGPWTELPAASPMPLSPVGEKGFFRVKVEQ